MMIKVLVDDLAPEDRRSVHGFSALVEAPDMTVLFDTGPDGDVMMEALEAEGLEVSDLDLVVLSHAHRDHSGGLARLLFERPRLTVSAPRAAAPSIAKGLPRKALVLGEDGPRDLAIDIGTTGDLGGDIPEQALLLWTGEGTVVLTGCGHPGLTALVGAAGGEVSLVIGGIHDLAPEQVPFPGVGRFVVCHCTPRKRIVARTHELVELGRVGTVVELAPRDTPLKLE